MAAKHNTSYYLSFFEAFHTLSLQSYKPQQTGFSNKENDFPQLDGSTVLVQLCKPDTMSCP